MKLKYVVIKVLFFKVKYCDCVTYTYSVTHELVGLHKSLFSDICIDTALWCTVYISTKLKLFQHNFKFLCYHKQLLPLTTCSLVCKRIVSEIIKM